MQPARFHTLRDRTLAIVDRVFAEPVKLSFLKLGYPDPDRQALVVEAPLRVGGGKETNAGNSNGHNWRTKLAAGKAELHLDRKTYQGPPIRSGDAVQALSRTGQPWFEVLRVDDRGETRLILELGEK